MSGCRGVGVSGSRGVGMSGCRGVGLSGCRDVGNANPRGIAECEKRGKTCSSPFRVGSTVCTGRQPTRNGGVQETRENMQRSIPRGCASRCARDTNPRGVEESGGKRVVAWPCNALRCRGVHGVAMPCAAMHCSVVPCVGHARVGQVGVADYYSTGARRARSPLGAAHNINIPSIAIACSARKFKHFIFTVN